MKSITIALFTVLLLNLACKTTPAENKADSYFETIAQNDKKLSPPQEGDWLYEHKEAGQDLADYRKAAASNDTSHKIIYLQPIGYFTPLQQKVLELTRAYVAIFFQQKTVLLKGLDDAPFPDSTQRTREDGHAQLLAPYILYDVLKKQLPVDALALMAITAKDLYPNPDWNFVFGLASYSDRVAVSSIYRLQSVHQDSTGLTVTLRRLMNVSTHEIGHILQMQHCTFAACVMNGSNSLQESDKAPNRLCSQCQQKMHWRFGYDNQQRLVALLHFFQQNHIIPGEKLLQSDFQLFNHQ